MFLRVTDGQVKLAAHKINVTIDPHNENLMKSLASYQQEDFGLVAYSVEEKDAILSVLSSFNTTNTVENLSYSVDVISKAQGEKYNSRTEALNDLLKIVNRTLNDIKNDKISELATSMNQKLVSGFTSNATGTPIGFGYNQYDQGYLHKKATMLTIDPTITSINWKTQLGMATFTRDQFIQVLKDGDAHEETLIYKLLNLEALVMNCADAASVNAIVWS